LLITRPYSYLVLNKDQWSQKDYINRELAQSHPEWILVAKLACANQWLYWQHVSNDAPFLAVPTCHSLIILNGIELNLTTQAKVQCFWEFISSVRNCFKMAAK
jgi:hypothetical protein